VNSETARRLKEARDYLAVPIEVIVAQTGLPADDLIEIESARLYGYSTAFFLGNSPASEPTNFPLVGRWAAELSEADYSEAVRFASYLRECDG
jgi:hypothetical protein